MINLFKARSLDETMDKFSTVFALLTIILILLLCCAVVKKLIYSENQNTSTHRCYQVEFTPDDTVCIKAKRSLSDKE